MKGQEVSIISLEKDKNLDCYLHKGEPGTYISY